MRPALRIAMAAVVLAGIASAGAVPAAEAQDQVRRVGGIELPLGAQDNLIQLRERWSRWEAAFDQGQGHVAEQSVEVLLETARNLGFERLPDLSIAASARAVEAAHRGQFERAELALNSAEKFDPGRPETAFASAVVHRAAGRSWAALTASFGGYLRAWRLPTERRVMWLNVEFVVLASLLLAGALFLALQMATKGGSLFADVVKRWVRWLPSALAYPLAALCLLWPLALPQGLLWLAVYWSVLLWGYGSASERVVLVILWLLLGVSPLLLEGQRARLGVALSPPARALDQLTAGRLYGELFSDLGGLPSLFPEEPAVEHLLGDLHRRLGYWPAARSLYEQLDEGDSGFPAVQINLGVFHFQQEKYSDAVRYFQRASQADPQNAKAFFNLSQAYSEEYHFSESSAALSRAQDLDRRQVGRWLAEAEQGQVRSTDEGIGRAPEIRDQLVALQRSDTLASRLSAARRWLTLALAGGVFLAALALHLLRRRFGYASPSLSDVGGGWADRVVRFLVPGFFSAEVGYGLRAYLTLLVPTTLVMIPLSRYFAYPVPFGVDPGRQLVWTLCVAGWVVFYGLRLAMEVRNPA
ncbi:MAG: tetratricopeptide repeat protein [Acidobacteriota bacterium]